MVIRAVAENPGPLPPYQALKPIAKAAKATSVAPLLRVPKAPWAPQAAATVKQAAEKRRMVDLEELRSIGGGYQLLACLSW
jgi:hypothetical protein